MLSLFREALPRLDARAVFYQACLQAQDGRGVPDNASLVLEILARELGLRSDDAAQLLQAARRDPAAPRLGFLRGRLYVTVSRHAHREGNVHPTDRSLLDRLAETLGMGSSEVLHLDRQCLLAA